MGGITDYSMFCTGYHDQSYHPPAQRSYGVQLSDSDDDDYGG